MSLVFAVTVLIINFVLWVLLLARFRSLFDTGDIVDKTKSEIADLTRDLNRVAQRDVALFNECSKQLHALLDDADKKVTALQDEVQKAAMAEAMRQAEREKESPLPAEQGNTEKDALPAIKAGSAKKRATLRYKRNKKTERRDASVAAAEGSGDEVKQPPLFEDRAESININVPALQGEEYAVPLSDAASGGVPSLSGGGDEYAASSMHPDYGGALGDHSKAREPIYLSDDNDNTKAADKGDVTSQVMAMARSGFSPEQIAERLSCSLTEVQMILDMSLVSGGE